MRDDLVAHRFAKRVAALSAAISEARAAIQEMPPPAEMTAEERESYDLLIASMRQAEEQLRPALARLETRLAELDDE